MRSGIQSFKGGSPLPYVGEGVKGAVYAKSDGKAVYVQQMWGGSDHHKGGRRDADLL
jgi:hypothetical protein